MWLKNWSGILIFTKIGQYLRNNVFFTDFTGQIFEFLKTFYIFHKPILGKKKLNRNTMYVIFIKIRQYFRNNTTVLNHFYWSNIWIKKKNIKHSHVQIVDRCLSMSKCGQICGWPNNWAYSKNDNWLKNMPKRVICPWLTRTQFFLLSINYNFIKFTQWQDPSYLQYLNLSVSV